MPDYSLYLMSPFSGHIERVTPIMAVDDAAAAVIMNGQPGHQPRELWCEHRKVLRLEADDPPNETITQWRARRMWENMISKAAEETPLDLAPEEGGVEPKSASACTLWPNHFPSLS